jgi:hypothetical protein
MGVHRGMHCVVDAIDKLEVQISILHPFKLRQPKRLLCAIAQSARHSSYSTLVPGGVYQCIRPIVNNQFTNLRSCTLIANPMAMNVASTEESPALIKGKGTPITGRKPSAMPTLMKI